MTGTAVPVPWLIAVAVVLMVFAGALAAVEAALTRLTRGEAATLVAEGRRRAPLVQRIVADPSPTLSASTLVRVTAEAAATVCVALVVEDLTERWWVGLIAAALLMGVLVFVLLGVSARTVGRQHAASVALASAAQMRMLTRLVGPLARLAVLVGNAVTPGRGYRDGPFASENQLRELVDRASESEVIEAAEQRMIHSVFELGDTLVREVMSPRTDMVTVTAAATTEEALGVFLGSGHSRVPVVATSVDDVVGVLYLKDVVRAQHDLTPGSAPLTAAVLAKTAAFVPESKRVDALLREMQQQSLHLAVVIDEYGGVAGLVTLEDVLEEIVGEIADEYDHEEPEVLPLGDGVFRVSPRLPVDELGALFGLDLDDDEVDSVGGLLVKALGTMATTGARVSTGGLHLTAGAVSGNRMSSVVVRLEDPDGRDDAAADGEGGHGDDRPRDDPRRDDPRRDDHRDDRPLDGRSPADPPHDDPQHPADGAAETPLRAPATGGPER